MQSEELINKVSDAIFDEWKDITTIRMSRPWVERLAKVAIEASLSTDAEPVALYRSNEKGNSWLQWLKSPDGYADGTALYAEPVNPAPVVVVKAEELARRLWGYFNGDSTGGNTAMQWFDNNKSVGGPAHVIELCRSALSAQVQDVAGYGDSQLAIIHSAIEKAANAADAAVYEAMRSNDFDPAIPDNVAEFVGKAVRKAFDANAHAPSSNHVNGGAYRIISVDEWRSLGGDENKFCDWHEGIGYVIYDDIAKEQYRAKIAAAPAAKQGEAE